MFTATLCISRIVGILVSSAMLNPRYPEPLTVEGGGFPNLPIMMIRP